MMTTTTSFVRTVFFVFNNGRGLDVAQAGVAVAVPGSFVGNHEVTTTALQIGAVIAKTVTFVFMRKARAFVFGLVGLVEIVGIARTYIAADPGRGEIFLARWRFVTCAATGHCTHVRVDAM